MAYSLCFLQPWIALFSGLSGQRVLWISITTSVFVFLSTLIFTSWKQKPGLLVGKPLREKQAAVQENYSSECSSDSVQVEVETKPVPVNKEDNDKEQDKSRNHEEYLFRSSQDHLYSESDIASMDQYSTSSEDSETNYWSYSGQKPDCSDDSMSDEEGLIEIAIPSGQYLSSQKDPDFEMKKKKSDFSPEGKLHQKGIPLEFLAEINEMNEEDSLIEIDIYMGSIKCSRFSI